MSERRRCERRRWGVALCGAMVGLVGGGATRVAGAASATEKVCIERVGEGSMLVAQRGTVRVTIPRAGAGAARRLWGRWQAHARAHPVGRDLLVIPDLSGAAGVVPAAMAGEDGVAGTADDLGMTEVLWPAGHLDPEDPVHVAVEQVVRASAGRSPSEGLCADPSDEGEASVCPEISAWAAPSSAFSVCVQVAGQVVWAPGNIGAAHYAESAESCPGATILWIHEVALDEALAGARAWIQDLPQDLVVVVSPDGSGRCAPRRSSIRALGPRPVVLVAPTGRHNTGACAGRRDTTEWAPATTPEGRCWVRP